MQTKLKLGGGATADAGRAGMAVQGGLKASRPPTTSRLGHCSLLLAPCSCLILSAWSVAPSPPRPHLPARAHPILRNSVLILIVAAPTTTTNYPAPPKAKPDHYGCAHSPSPASFPRLGPYRPQPAKAAGGLDRPVGQLVRDRRSCRPAELLPSRCCRFAYACPAMCC